MNNQIINAIGDNFIQLGLLIGITLWGIAEIVKQWRSGFREDDE